MGACFSTVGLVLYKRIHGSSSTTPSSISSTAKVISPNGGLREYKLPITVSQALQSTEYPTAHLLCNSDSLDYNETIPAMSSNEQLLADQIYFLLPISKINDRISPADMVALAVKASAALQCIEKSLPNSKKTMWRCKNENTRISPLLVVEDAAAHEGFDHCREISGLDKEVLDHLQECRSNGIFRSQSVRKLQRYTSKRAKLAVRSFRLRLSTIYEGTAIY